MKLLDDEWKHVSHAVALERPEYLFELDEYRNADAQMLFVHLLVRVWSKAVLKNLLREFAAFRQCVSCPLYCIGITDDDKWAAFVSFFGFRFLTDVVCENGERRRLYINLATVKEEEKKHGKPYPVIPDAELVVADQPVGVTGSVPDAGVRRSEQRAQPIK